MQALEDYQKSELIDGVVYDMSPANMKHIFIQGNLFNIIRNFLHGKRCKVMFEAEVRFDERNKFIPDIAIVCKPEQIKSSYIDGAPDFVAEVLSRSTISFIPSMALIGVRISCDILARKSLLAALARSAASLAIFISASFWADSA